MKFALSVWSLDGTCRRLEVEADGTSLMAELEQGLPDFHEIRLFQGHRELVVGRAAVEVELQSVVMHSPSKALAVLESLMETLGRYDPACFEALPETFHAVQALGKMPGDLSVDDSARLFSFCQKMCRNPWRSDRFEELAVTMGQVFGRKCADPKVYIEELYEMGQQVNLADHKASAPAIIAARSNVNGWTASALAEIAARCDGEMNGQSEKLVAWAENRINRLRGGSLPFGGSYWAFAVAFVRLLGQLGGLSHSGLIQECQKDYFEHYAGSLWADDLMEKLCDEVKSAVALIESRAQAPAGCPAADSFAMPSQIYMHEAARTNTPDVEDEHLQEKDIIVETCETEEAIRRSREEYEREQITSAIVGSIFSKKLEDVGVQPRAFSEHATIVSAHSGDAASKGSCASVVSFVSGISAAGPKCFLPGSLLKMRNKSWAPVEAIHVGQWVLSYEGQPLQVKRATKHTQDEVVVTELMCPCATMRFTNSHPVVTPEGYKLAGDLSDGDHVSIMTSLPCGVTRTETHPLTSVQSQSVGQSDVYELIFDPDKPVESFLEPTEKILSKGPNVNEAKKRRCHRQAKRLHKLKEQIQRPTPEVTPANSDTEQHPAATSSAVYVQPAAPINSD